MTDAAPHHELDEERAWVARIAGVHAAKIAASAELARRLAADAAIQTEDGIRDLVEDDIDDDDAVDAAIEASVVRQQSIQAIDAFRRVADLQRGGDARVFGHVTTDEGERTRVGRFSVIDDDEVLMVDWRASAAAVFYQATPLERRGVKHRRHLLYDDDAPDDTVPELESYSDELFGDDAVSAGGPELRGEAALLHALTTNTDEHMRSVVATIQTEQDEVIRAESHGPLVVQGGPGTGKTVVALHRAAYLLYHQRSTLAESGVLIVGPTPEFLTYISSVLPSLGESGVVSVTPNQLHPGVRGGYRDTPEVAEIKGRFAMASLLANAVTDRQRRPNNDLLVGFGTDQVRLSVAELGELFDRAQRWGAHNAGAAAFATGVVDALTWKVHNPEFTEIEEVRSAFVEAKRVKRFLLAHWPTLSPEQALNDLLGSVPLLRLAARGTGMAHEVEALHRERTSEADLPTRRWSAADIPLLDELHHLLGTYGDDIDTVRLVERDEASEFDLAAQRDEQGRDYRDLESPSLADAEWVDADGDLIESLSVIDADDPAASYEMTEWTGERQ